MRDRKDETGIYGTIPQLSLQTLEHAYEIGCDPEPPVWSAKITDGAWKCVRGEHILHSGLRFNTFEVIGIPNHTGLLFHCGNIENNSTGCVLLGMTRVGNTLQSSRVAFAKFMSAQDGCDEFELTVRDL
jgi:hypothetical protein